MPLKDKYFYRFIIWFLAILIYSTSVAALFDYLVDKRVQSITKGLEEQHAEAEILINKVNASLEQLQYLVDKSNRDSVDKSSSKRIENKPLD